MTFDSSRNEWIIFQKTQFEDELRDKVKVIDSTAVQVGESSVEGSEEDGVDLFA